MTFFSRPNLDDIQFKQTPGSSLSLSGQTRVKSWSGLTLSDGAGNDIIVTASGASSGTTEGYVLTYMHGLISLQPSSASGGTFQFTCGQTPITRFEGEDDIYNINVSADTINTFLERFFFPAVDPVASLSIASGGVDREFGNTSVGNLAYSGICKTNQICLIALDKNADGSYDTYPVSSAIVGSCIDTVTYSYIFDCATPPTGTSTTSETFKICVEDVNDKCDITSTSITWRNKKFTLKSSTLYNDSSISNIMTGGELSTIIDKELINETFNNQFFYFTYPTSFGTPTITVNGLVNNAWGSSDNNTLYKFNYTNSNGYTNQYYVARSDSRITGTFNINIT